MGALVSVLLPVVLDWINRSFLSEIYQFVRVALMCVMSVLARHSFGTDHIRD